MDKDTRNRIQRATQAARGLLEQDFEDQLAGVFDIRLDGTIAAESGSHLDAAQRIVRTKLVAAVEHFRASGQTAAEAVASYRREAAFTTLNRFVALKMLEARGLVQECISRGEQSSGFKEFCGLAPGLVQLPDRGYRLYIESLFDELSVQIRVLFNRRDAGSLLWPKRATIEALLAGLNAPELADVWSDDETIGWIYQYYNDEAERKRMREESSAPRNSRELAVRNQFFTPRYVVEFLTDNTLGRLWYEMTRGQTGLKEQCRYLVRRPTEIFLEPGESPPKGATDSEAKANDTLSQEELLRQPVHIPHRPLKDPREIRLLDPACGSMHFGLYAFDLFEAIYAEAWDIAQGPDDSAKAAESFAPFVSFAAAFADQAAFLREVPRLIIEHNLHGIDIDRRAVQIAGLSLWLRAQRAWHQAGLKPVDRPRITRSNLVCAEPMPGEKELLREFVDQQFPVGEQPAFTFLLEKVFDRMTLAGEAGSLLRIEEEIGDAIAEARALAQRQAGPRQFRLSLGDEQPEQSEPDLLRLNDEQFWQAAEQRIYDALKAYAERTESGSGFRRRLFADDAAQGFAFIDISRKRYDLVVMNPPFGDPPLRPNACLQSSYLAVKHDLASAFIERALELVNSYGVVGSITTRTLFFLSYLAEWREKVIIDNTFVALFADFGDGVLEATIETAAHVIYRSSSPNCHSWFVRVLEDKRRKQDLLEAIDSTRNGHFTHTVFLCDISTFKAIARAPFAYSVTDEVRMAFKKLPPFQTNTRRGFIGALTQDDFRFTRAWWETRASDAGRGWTSGSSAVWVPYTKGGSYTPYYADFPLTINWWNDGSELKAFLTAYRNKRGFADQWTSQLNAYERYFLAGITWSSRPNPQGSFWVMPSGVVFGNSGPAVQSSREDLVWLLGILNSRSYRAFLDLLMPRGATSGQSLKYEVGYVRTVPIPHVEAESHLQVLSSVESCVFNLSRLASADECSHRFIFPSRFKFNQQASFKQHWESEVQARATVVDEIVEHVNQIDGISEKAYSLSNSARVSLYQNTAASSLANNIESNTFCAPLNKLTLICSHVSFCVGCILGRWDIRYAISERPAPELPDHFAPLPVCPPGMLQGNDSLPLSPEAGRRLRAEGLYPLDVAWDGILVDDPEHPLDIERRVHDALAVICGDRTDAIEQEACDLLGVPTMRDWFRWPAGFFADHLKRYSKSRRQAPIYWPVSSPGGRYTLWLYYHRFSKDTLYRALEQVKEKVSYEERRLQRLTSDAGSSPGAAERAALADQESFVTELRTFHEELARVAPLWNPDLNDGVILNYGPLWRMIGHTPWQKAVKEKWDDLVAGKTDWAHLAMHLWPERVVPKCAKDRSLAIAHGLEDVFWKEGDKGKWLPCTVAQAEIDYLIAERTSAAVKDALKSLLEAPSPVTGRGGGRKSSGRTPVRRAPTVPRSDNAGPGSRPATGSAAPDPVMLDAVKQVIAVAQGGTSKSEVLAATGLTDAQWNSAINALLAAGTVTKTGAGRGTRYLLSSHS